VSRPVLILRPAPGAGRTAVKARGAGLEPVVAPLFHVRPLAWSAPDPAAFDALLLTSANAARHGGAALALYRRLPAYAVGAATAREAAMAGWERVITGSGDSGAVIARAVSDGRRRLLHLAGREHIAAEDKGAVVERRIVYASEAVDSLPPQAIEALAADAVVLIHSARAGALLRSLLDAAGIVVDRIAIAAISTVALAAAGEGWRERAAAESPDDTALLAVAARLCD